METKHITCSAEKLSTNFTMAEFYTAANPDQEFDIPVPLIKAAQIIRDWVGFTTNVTSTKRSKDTWGPHMLGKAVDFSTPYYIHGKPAPHSPEEVFAAFRKECENYIAGKQSHLISRLREVGVDGFGCEQVCIHLDCGYKVGTREDQYGKYRIFVFKCHYNSNGEMIIDENRAL